MNKVFHIGTYQTTYTPIPIKTNITLRSQYYYCPIISAHWYIGLALVIFLTYLYFSVWATETKTHSLCQCVYSGCVLFVMNWCEHIINSQLKVTRSQRSIDRADSDVKWPDVQRVPSGPRGKTWQSGVTFASPGVTHAGRQATVALPEPSDFTHFPTVFTSHGFDMAVGFFPT